MPSNKDFIPAEQLSFSHPSTGNCKPHCHPTIIRPEDNSTEEVELGRRNQQNWNWATFIHFTVKIWFGCFSCFYGLPERSWENKLCINMKHLCCRSVLHSGMPNIFSFWDQLRTRAAVAPEFWREYGQHDPSRNGKSRVSPSANVNQASSCELLRNLQLIASLKLEMPKIDQENKVTRTAVIKEVTVQHLQSTYTCSARNWFGNSSVTIRLKKKNKGTIFRSPCYTTDKLLELCCLWFEYSLKKQIFIS